MLVLPYSEFPLRIWYRHHVARQPVMTYRVNFDEIAWESPMPGVRHKLHQVGDRVLRLVEYSQEMVPHWCSNGHVGHIVEGSMEIEFRGGTEVYSTGDALFIPPGPGHAHRAVVLSGAVRALFVEDA